MGDPLLEFKITVTVEHNHTRYQKSKYGDINNCNHADNIPSVADYIGQEILKEIKQKRANKPMQESGS